MFVKNCNSYISTSYYDLKELLNNLESSIKKNQIIIIEYYVDFDLISYLNTIEIVKDPDNNNIECINTDIKTGINYYDSDNIKELINEKITNNNFCNIQLIP